MKTKKIITSLVVLLVIGLTVASCNKEDPDNLSGTTWWTEMPVDSSNGERCHIEISFAENTFTQILTFPYSPGYPPARYVGIYSFAYPRITLACSEFKDVAIMDSDRKSFILGSYIFVKNER